MDCYVFGPFFQGAQIKLKWPAHNQQRIPFLFLLATGYAEFATSFLKHLTMDARCVTNAALQRCKDLQHSKLSLLSRPCRNEQQL